MRIKISEKQQQFLESQSWGTIFRAGIASGKTLILCTKAILNALERRRELVVSFSYPMLRDVVAVSMLEVLEKMELKQPTDFTYNKTDHAFIVRGTEILLRSGDAPDSLRGLNVHDFLIDEARQFNDRSIYDILVGRIRNAEDSRWYMCTTPNGHDWAHTLTDQSKEISVITQSTLENPFLPISFIRRLLDTYQGIFAEQEIYGKVVEFVGEIIDPSGFKVVPLMPVSEGVRYWDLAFTDKKKSDWSVGALCLNSGHEFCVADIIRVRAKYPDLKELIVNTAITDGRGVKIGLEDAGQQRAVIDDIARDKRLLNHVITTRRPLGSKMSRAMPWASRIKLGGVKVCQGGWLDCFRAECAAFRADMTHPYDDQIDAISGAWEVLMCSRVAQSMRIKI